jgi:hypothetical protein
MSDPIEARVTDLERRISTVQAEVEACVRELLVDDDARYLIAERLPALGSAALPTVQALVRDPNSDHEVRVLAALVAVEVGDREQALETLLDEVKAADEFAPLAARRLAEHRIAQAAPAILDALRRTSSGDVDAVLAYLEALHHLGERLPEDEEQRLKESDAWQVTTALHQWHGGPTTDG